MKDNELIDRLTIGKELTIAVTALKKFDIVKNQDDVNNFIAEVLKFFCIYDAFSKDIEAPVIQENAQKKINDISNEEEIIDEMVELEEEIGRENALLSLFIAFRNILDENKYRDRETDYIA